MFNVEDLNWFIVCFFVFLGYIFYVLGNYRESNNMVVFVM